MQTQRAGRRFRRKHGDEKILIANHGGKASTYSCLRLDKLLTAAKVTGANAVHASYCFLSEQHAGFA